jgi:hypothetical protein
MVYSCAVIGCSSRTGSKDDPEKKTFFRIPHAKENHSLECAKLAEERRQVWISRINIADLKVTDHTRVCSIHFVGGKPADLIDNKNPDWSPSLNLGYQQSDLISPENAKYRYERCKRRNELPPPKNLFPRKKIKICKKVTQVSSPSPPDDFVDEELSKEVEVQTETTMFLMDDMKKEISRLQRELSMSRIGTKEWFNNTQKVKFYTGLPNLEMLETVFDFLIGCYTPPNSTLLAPFQEFTLTIMRLRLNLTLNDLAYRFQISNTRVSVIFLKWLDVMFVSLQGLILWPSREQLWATTPLAFRQYFGTRVVIIIDCFGPTGKSSRESYDMEQLQTP